MMYFVLMSVRVTFVVLRVKLASGLSFGSAAYLLLVCRWVTRRLVLVCRHRLTRLWAELGRFVLSSLVAKGVTIFVTFRR